MKLRDFGRKKNQESFETVQQRRPQEVTNENIEKFVLFIYLPPLPAEKEQIGLDYYGKQGEF